MKHGALGDSESLFGSLSSPEAIEGVLSAPESLNGVVAVSSYRYITELDYEKLMNHPSINNVELIKNKGFDELGLEAMSNLELEALLS